MRQKTLLKIIGLMRTNLDRGLTILEISKKLKIGYRPAYNHITEMEKEDNSDDETEDETKLEGYFYVNKKKEGDKFVKHWFKLFHKDFCSNIILTINIGYEDKESKELKSVSNLSGVFTEEADSITINGEQKYGLQLIFGTDIMKYYCDSVEQRENWLKAIRKATGYINIKDIYEVLVSILYVIIITRVK